MLQLVILHFALAVVAPIAVGRWGRRTFLALAAAPGAAAVWAATRTPEIRDEPVPTQVVDWAPSIGLSLDFRLDALSWLMVVLVGGVGALVLLYSSAYFSPSSSNLGRFAAVFVAFAGAMLGLVTSDNVLLLFVFWELTTVFSYLLIGHYFDRKASRRAAMQAIVVTTFGGLAMLLGLLMLADAAGTYSVSEMLASPPRGSAVNAAVVLVLLGAVTKSALVPFHFWLPAAMAAPTPVSAYLHAAAMVKAGVYLVARLAPGFADLAFWRWPVVVLGSATLLVGGYRSLRQHDLKLLLAFGTVSQLGLMVVLVGIGSRAVALGGLALIAAHAMFKASLFLAVGVIDDAVGTRDLRELSGLASRLPYTAAAAAFATASMIGLAPFAGYVAKEAALEGLWHDGDAFGVAVFAVVVLGSALTVAYGLRFWWGAFGRKPASSGVQPCEPERPTPLLRIPPVVLATGGLVVGLLPGWLESVIAPHAESYPIGEAGYLVLWAGFGAPLFGTLVALLGGAVLFVARAWVERVQGAAPAVPDVDVTYRRSMRRLDSGATAVTGLTQRGSLPAYLGVILVFTVALALATTLAGGFDTPEVRLWDSPVQLVLAAVVAAAAILAVRARRRLKAVLLAGVSGYGVAVLFALHGAPDLALTQVLVETVTLVVFVLVLRRLPAYFSNRPLAGSRWWRAALGLAVGLTVAGLAVIAPAARVHTPVSVDYPEQAYVFGHGKNIVNVTLVDIRAWDTMGEIAVVLVAATGVASLVFLRFRMRAIDRVRDLTPETAAAVWAGGPDPMAVLRNPTRFGGPGAPPGPGRGQEWLTGGASLAPHRRSVVLEVVTRLVFHAMLVFSVFLLFAGHNAPGGGFAAGLVAGIALTIRYLAGGRYELGEAVPIHPGLLLGTGLFLSVGVGLLPLAFGGDMLQSALVEVDLGPIGVVKLVTALFFDIGVFLVVIGLVLDVLRTLGAEVDRQGEAEGLSVPDVAFDSPLVTVDDAEPTLELPAQNGGSQP